MGSDVSLRGESSVQDGTSQADEATAARRGVKRRALLAAAAAGALVVLLLSDLAICPFAHLTGQPCPGCGMTRACMALLSGDLAHALRMHPLSPICLPVVAALAAEGLFAFVTGRQPAWSQRVLSALRLDGNWLFSILVALLLLVWVLRFFGALGGPVPITARSFDLA